MPCVKWPGWRRRLLTIEFISAPLDTTFIHLRDQKLLSRHQWISLYNMNSLIVRPKRRQSKSSRTKDTFRWIYMLCRTPLQEQIQSQETLKFLLHDPTSFSIKPIIELFNKYCLIVSYNLNFLNYFLNFPYNFS